MVYFTKFMWENKSVEEQVKEAISPVVETVPTTETKEVSSTEVKPTEQSVETKKEETPTVVEQNNVVNKSDEELKNIKIALSVERDEKKQLKEELEKTKSVYEKLQQAFAPEPVAPAPEITEEDKFEKWYSEKEQQKREEENTKKTQETIKSQIEKLSQEWNGEDWKPKYDDAEVYKWQKENGKLYLMPEEAFVLMKQSDIIDYKAKQALWQSKSWVSAERPGGSSTEHTPEKTVAKTDSEIKNAVLEVLSSAE